MTGDVIITAVRSTLLIGMLAYFGLSLGRTLMIDQAKHAFPLGEEATKDPGIRVLLIDRKNNDLSHEKISLSVIRPAYITTPDDRDNPERLLPVNPGEDVLIRPDGSDGLMISSETWGKELHWPVSHVRIQPQLTQPALNDVAPGQRDIRQFEAQDGEEVFALNGRHYRGNLEVTWKSSKELFVTNVLPIEAYVEGVIAVEMKSSYPLEALKAQAIASRSYAFATQLLTKSLPRPYDLTDSLDDQEYKGAGFGEPLSTTAAVHQTRGLVMLANGSPFVPLFSASSGGYSESVEAVCPGATDVRNRVSLAPFMPSQPDDACEAAAQRLGNASTHWGTTAVLKRMDIMRKVSDHLKRTKDNRVLGFIIGITVSKRDPESRRVEAVQINHTNGKPIELTGHQFRMIMGPQIIRSTLWSDDSPKKVDGADRHDKDYQIQCRGYGHGVGMSQISAWWLANEKGWVCTRILERFYPGVRLQTW